MSTQRTALTVIYKSGAKMDLTCDSFEVRMRGAEVVEVLWEKPRPRPMFFGVDNVEAIYQHVPEPDEDADAA